MKERTCKICKKPSRFPLCSYKCAVESANRSRLKREKRETKAKLDKLKSLSEWLKEAQGECNAYIRERDSEKPCISCGRFHDGQYHAGHYRTVGAAPQLRFHEDNIHKQCAPCNNHKSGNAIEYRINLIKKIGIERVEALESDNTPRKFTVEDAKRIKQEFKDKRKQLEKGLR